MKVLGIDPGYDRLGIAVVDGDRSKSSLIYSTCIETKKTDIFRDRLMVVARAVKETINVWHPDVVAIETLFFTTNQKTAMAVSEARGAILFVVAESGVDIFECTPLQVKVAITGYGKSGKTEISRMLKHLIVLPKKKMRDDEYDAIAIALTALAMKK